jgi:hypothetical protein
MDPVRSVRNQYFGINAHLHSRWQAVRGWNNFHNPYIVQLATALKARIWPLGYTAEIEDSLQIRRVDEYQQRLQSDITIHDRLPERAAQPVGAARGLSGLVVPLPVVLDANPLSERPYGALAMYEQRDTQTPIAWLEVLSPSNKRPGADAGAYRRQRRDLLDAGIVFVEIDFLHETPPTLPGVADYSRTPNDAASPYRIVVLDPRPDTQHGLASLNEFAVDESIPTISIPLSGEDQLAFDFNAPYQRLYQEMLYGLDTVDYATLPSNFERYSPADRARIANRMLAVLATVQSGADLEAGPLPAAALSLDEALGRLTELGVT